MGFGSSLKKAFKKAGKWVKGAAKDVYKETKPVVNTLYKDAKAVVAFEGKQLSKIVNSGTGLVDSIGNTLPYLIGAVAVVGVAYVAMNSGTKRQYSRSSTGGSNKRFKYTYGLANC